VPSAVDPNTTLPNSFTDQAGLELGLCTNTGCAGARPDQGQPVAVPGNFFGDAEAFWYLNTVELNSGAAEFAVEAAFEDLLPNNGGAFTRQRFRFSNLTGTIRLTTPYGTRIYDDLGGGNRTINDTVDLGIVGGCPGTVGFCDYAGANYGNELTHYLVPVDFVPGAPGTVTTYTGPVVGSPTGYNGVKLERQDGTDAAGAPIWTLIEEQKNFTLEMQTASAPAAPVVFAGLSSTTVDFPGRRSDESSGTKRVTVRNDGAAPMNISNVALSGFDAGSFTATGCAAGTLAPHASCDVTVGFVGTAVGTHEAMLTISNDSANAPTLQVALSGLVTGLATAPAAAPTPGTTTTIIQTIPGPGAAATNPTQGVLGSQTASPLRVSNLSLARRISVTRLRLQGLRASMRLPQGSDVVRIAVYKARNGKKTGRALFTTIRTPRSGGLYRVTLRNRSLLRKLRAGSYVVEVQAGRSAASLGSVRRIAFTVTR
jgi:hypothetical protein